MERPGRDRVAAVTGVLSVVVLLAGLYVAPDLVYPEEQVGGVSGTFYVNYESRLLAQAVLFGVASVLFLFFLGGLRAFLARAEGQEPRLAPIVLAAGAVFTALGLLQAAVLTALVALRGNELACARKAVGGRPERCSTLRGRLGTWPSSRLPRSWLLPRWCWFAPGCCHVGWAGWGPRLGSLWACWLLGPSSD